MASPRMAVDLPVLRSPNTRTPPTVGSMAAMSNACFNSSCPTIAQNGNTARRGPVTAGKPEWLSCQDNRNRYWRHPWFTNAAGRAPLCAGRPFMAMG